MKDPLGLWDGSEALDALLNFLMNEENQEPVGEDICPHGHCWQARRQELECGSLVRDCVRQEERKLENVS